MAMVEIKRDFRVLRESISPENVLVMAELLTLNQVKWFIGSGNSLAIGLRKKLYCDVICKNEEGYVFSDGYDMVQEVALFLCQHYGEYIDDFLYATKNGKKITIKFYCYKIVSRLFSARCRRRNKYTSLENLIKEPKSEVAIEQDYSKFDEILERLNLSEHREVILNCRMSGISVPEISRIVNRAISTVWQSLAVIRKRYMEITG